MAFTSEGKINKKETAAWGMDIKKRNKVQTRGETQILIDWS